MTSPLDALAQKPLLDQEKTAHLTYTGQGEEDPLKGINEGIEKGMKALQDRYDQPNWFKIAAGFAKPQLGGFAASLGSAADAYGDTVEQRRALEPALFKMRTELGVNSALMKRNKEVDDEIAAYRQFHPNLPLPDDKIQDWAGRAPNSSGVKSLLAERTNRQKNQEINIQGAGAISKILEEARVGGYNPRPMLAKAGFDAKTIEEALNAMPNVNNGKSATGAGGGGGGNNTEPVKSNFSVSGKYGTPEVLLDNLAMMEGGKNPLSLNAQSKAMGNYQFTPETLVDLHKKGIEFNPLKKDEARAAADWYLQKLLQENGGDWNKALAAYGGFKKNYKQDDLNKYIGSITKGVDFSKKPEVSSAAEEESVGVIRPSNEKLMQGMTTAQKQQINYENAQKIQEYQREQGLTLGNPLMRNRIGNLNAAYEVLANNPKLQQIVGRYSEADASTLAKAALESGTVPDFVKRASEAIGSKLPTDDPKTIQDLYAYARYAANEKMFIDQLSKNPTNQFRTQENDVAFGLRQPPEDALMNITSRLHDLKLPYQKAHAFNYLARNAPTGTSLNDILENELLQHAERHHGARHQNIVSKQFLKPSNGKWRNKLDVDLQPNAFTYDPETYKLPTRKEINAFKGNK